MRTMEVSAHANAKNVGIARRGRMGEKEKREKKKPRYVPCRCDGKKALSSFLPFSLVDSTTGSSDCKKALGKLRHGAVSPHVITRAVYHRHSRAGVCMKKKSSASIFARSEREGRERKREIGATRGGIKGKIRY